MSTLTTENPREAADRATVLRYVLVLTGRNLYLDTTITTEDVTGAVTDLTRGLRPWLLTHLRSASRDNGWYVGYLVAPDEQGDYDTYDSLAVEDVLWYWDEECAPLSRCTK